MWNPGLEHLADKIFEEIEDPQDIANCRLVSKHWRQYIDSNNHWWNLQLIEIGNCYVELYEWEITRLGKIPSWLKVISHFMNNANNDFETFKFFTTTMIEFYSHELKNIGDYHYFSRYQMDTPLHWAIWRHKAYPDKKNMEFIRILPLELIDMTETEPTPLHRAISEDNVEVVEMILNVARDWPEGYPEPEYDEDGCNVAYVPNFLNYSAGEGFTVFHQACYCENPEIIEMLIKASETKGLELHTTSGIKNFRTCRITPVHHATHPYDPHKNTATALKVLLKYAEEKNFELFGRITGDGSEPMVDGSWTPFECACQFGNVEAVKVFMEYFKEKGIKVTDHGMRPLICACKRTEIFDDCTTGWDTYHDRNYESRTEIAKILVEHYEENGIDLKTKDDLDRNALHHACASGSTEIAELLLEHGFGDEINTRDENGRTPLHHACSVFNDEEEGSAGYPKTIDFLLSKMEDLDLDPNIEDNEGQTAIQSVNCPYYHGNTTEDIMVIFQKYGITKVSE